MPRSLAIILSLTLLVAGGIVHGLYANRWQKSTALEEAIERVPLTPKEFDGWTSTDETTNSKEYDQAGARAYWARTYRNKDGCEFLVILMVGRSGRMAVHTPEVCYRGAGFDLYGAPSLYTARAKSGKELGVLWSATFIQPAKHNELQLCWTWSDGSLWSAPTNPRWTFAGQPALFKLYISQDVSGLPPGAGVKYREEFLRAFLPAMNQTLGIEKKNEG